MVLIVMTHPAKSAISRTLLLTLMLLCVTAALPTLASGQIFKWVDAAGSTHYTQLPPPEGITATKVRRAPAAADNSATATSQQQPVEAKDTAAGQTMSEAEVAAENARIAKENCAIAKKNLAELQQGGIKRYRTSDGKVIRLTEEDRQQRIAEANSQIKEFCK